MNRQTILKEYEAIFNNPTLTPDEQDSEATDKFCKEEQGFTRANQLDLLAQIEKVAGRNIDGIRLWIELQKL